jgi:hypothetical protein
MAEPWPVLKCSFSFEATNEKGKVLVELGDEKWLWDLAQLCDISH